MKNKGGMPGPFQMKAKSEPMAALKKQIQADQKGLQKLASKSPETVKNMGYTKDVDGAMLMNKDYALKAGGYGSPMKKEMDPLMKYGNHALRSDKGYALRRENKTNPHPAGTEAHAKWEKENNSGKSITISPVTGEPISEEKKAEYNKQRKKSSARQAHNQRYDVGTGPYEGTYYDRVKNKRFRGPAPEFDPSSIKG